ncbi:FtsX-like permease family protein [Desulfitobacterium sp.]|uniref:FtsX-like permease family protein n=1 Tax=Desulfitobacterium sp. TaxID=49981 RepID=UPI002BCA9462|nr:FtsX-like permease family protein [Desulfitobacterium sp.]HVJ47905.1 FtsX-like permease family protein [Desulfitobacterium sp.]
MHKKALNKDILKEFTKSITRFLSIMLMIALGSFVFVGLFVTGPTMRNTLLTYADKNNLEDLIVTSPLGLAMEDEQILNSVPGVEILDYSYRTDLMQRGSDTIVRAESLGKLPGYEILEGRLPAGADELALDGKMRGKGYKIGDHISFNPDKVQGSYALKNYDFVIVGFVNSPEYLMPTDKGSSSIGDGVVNCFGVIAKENFIMKNVSLARLTFSDVQGLNSYSTEYKDKMKAHSNAVEQALANRPEIRLEQYRKEGTADISTAQGKINDAEQQLSDAKKELDDARVELDKGWAVYWNLQAQNTSGQEVLASKARLGDYAKLAEAKVQLADGQKQLADAQKKIDASRTELDAKTTELQDGLDKIQQGMSQINAGLAEIEASLPQLTTGLSQVETGLQQTDAGLASLADSITLIDSQLADVNKSLAANAQNTQLLQTKAELEQKRADLVAQKTALEAKKASLQVQRTDLQNKQAEAVSKKKELQAQYTALVAQRQTTLDSSSLLTDARDKLNNSQQTLDKQRTDFNAKKADYEAALQSMHQKLLNGEADYEQGRSAYLDKLPAAQQEIEQGKTDLNKAKNDLARLKVPDYTINDRYKDKGFYQYIQNSESMDLLSLFFSVFFFLIALLVSLTTMMRMVDEQRLQIGTLKALGYSNRDVIKKYLAYGSLASLIGSLIGIVAGQKILMPVIFNAYSSNFLFKQGIPLLSPIFSVIAVLISLLCTGFVAFLTTRESLKDNVAELLRPKAPKSGNRILLERFTPLWRRLSFNYKVTARNIFRYKKRMLMTILGVAGCTALIFMGFGIRDSVGSLFVKQYGEILRYDSIMIFDENAAKEDLQALSDGLGSDSRIAKVYPARFEQGVVQIPGKLNQTVAVVVPEDAAAFQTINQLRERKSQKPITLRDGAVISEKIAMLLGLGVGDTLEFKDNDGTFKTIEIAGITENYAGHYFYMSPSYYEKIFGKTYHTNSDYISLQDHSAESVSSFSKSMLEKDVVLRMVNTNVASDLIGDLTKSLNIVVLVIVLASSLLAIVVLYNLTNINVSERIRELSTIKVLGFYPREVTAYVYRETMILTTIGIFIGYIFGLLLHSFIVTTMAPPNVLLDPAVKPASYILAAAFTFAFSFVVMLITHRRLNRIDMVEALKAVE